MPKASSKSKVGRPRKEMDLSNEDDAEELRCLILEEGGGEVPGPSGEHPQIVDLGEDG